MRKGRPGKASIWVSERKACTEAAVSQMEAEFDVGVYPIARGKAAKLGLVHLGFRQRRFGRWNPPPGFFKV